MRRVALSEPGGPITPAHGKPERARQGVYYG
jgi:hypothetical protein